MRAFELIDILYDIANEHGDVRVLIRDDSTRWLLEIHDEKMETLPHGDEKVFVIEGTW